MLITLVTLAGLNFSWELCSNKICPECCSIKMPLSDSNCKLLESNLAEIFEFVSKVSKLLFHTKIESPYAKTLKENKEKIKTAIKIGLRIILFVVLLFAMQQIVHAASFEETKLVIGTQNLVNAVIKWLTGIGITICGGYFIYYVYCLKTNDEGERRRNMQNIKTTLISMVLITCGLALIDVILGFYR